MEELNILLQSRHPRHHVDVLEDGVVHPRLTRPRGSGFLLQQRRDEILAEDEGNDNLGKDKKYF